MTASDMTAANRLGALAEPRPWRRAALWFAFVAPFFYVTYAGSNWLAAQRAEVPSIIFGWEHAIPFLDWTALPYWSINVVFAVSFFLCTTSDELDRHARRLITAQVIAVLCFLLFPLRVGFPRPESHSLTGLLSAALTIIDKPFNQAPSLHIVMLVIYWVLYARHLPRRAMAPLHVWFALIGVSVLTTYQHHFIDMPTGALLGFLVLWLWPDSGPAPHQLFRLARERRRLARAAGHAAGSAIIAGLALWLGGGGLWLLWPAIALAMVAVIHTWLGTSGFQFGPDGRMSLAVRVLLAPYLAGAWITARAAERQA